MNDAIRRAFEEDRLFDITTTGRVSGQPHKIEIWIHYLGEDELYLTGTPRPRQRDWLRNIVANPRMTVHLKQSMQADLPATGTPIRDTSDRREILTRLLKNMGRDLSELDQWVAQSPLVRLTLTGPASN
jgi:deazaflavin-dependent oxidoreductase (nitroreductase family)